MCALKSIVFTYFMCVCICARMCSSVRSGRAVRTLGESMLSLYHVNPRDQMHRADGCLYSVYFFIFIQFWTPDHKLVLPTLRLGLLNSIN